MIRPTELVLGSDELEVVLLPELGGRIHRLRAFGTDLLRTPALREFVSTVLAACDVLHLPTLPIAGPTLADTAVGGGAPMWQKIAAMVPCTAPFNYLGLPALSMPCGFTPNGVPTGFQLVARPYGEPTLLRVAQAYEPFSAPLRRAPSLPA